MEATEGRGAERAPPLRASVPPRVRRELAEFVAPGEELRLAVTTDIRLDGRYGEAWLMATDDVLVAFSPDSGGPPDLVCLPLAEIRGVEVREDLGTAALKVRTHERGSLPGALLGQALDALHDELGRPLGQFEHRLGRHLQTVV